MGYEARAPPASQAAVASADVQPSVEAINEDSSSSLSDNTKYWLSSGARNLFAPTPVGKEP